MFSEDSLGPVVIETTSASPAQRTGKQGNGNKHSGLLVSVLGLASVTLLLFYFIIRNLALLDTAYRPLDRVASILLLLSEVYISIQGIGYYIQVSQSLRTTNIARDNCLAKLAMPTVAVYIATYNEPASVIEETAMAVSLLCYPNLAIYLNCDHQSAEQAAVVAAIAERHHLHFLHRVPNTGYKAGGINAMIERIGYDLPDADFLCIFDADSIPLPTFLSEIVPYFNRDPQIAYVQAPQHYGNRDASLVADASGHQQATFAQFISEGKQQSEAMFYCGANVVFRVDALRDIGGLLIESITEDFNTSIKLHARGWKSHYCNTAYVTGMGPTTLQAYWTQQSRWALGNLESFRMSFGAIFWKPGLKLLQRWEYFLSGTYFLVGWNTFLSILLPCLFLLFGIRPLIMSPIIYIVAYLPHFAVSNCFFFITMGQRGFRPRVLFLAQCLTFITFPVFMSAAVAAALRRKEAFAVTPKGSGETALPWSAFLPHITMMTLLVIAIMAGSIQFVATQNLSVLVNIAWCAYHLALLSTFVLFNQQGTDVLERSSSFDAIARKASLL